MTSLLNRRRILQLGSGAVFISAFPSQLSAEPDDMQAAIKELFGDRNINQGKVGLKLPPISENGFSVPLTVQVESPMQSNDYVKQIAVFSPRNPLPNLIRFQLSPSSGKAEVSCRVRLSGTQSVTAIAEMSDGSLWSGTAETVVTLAACVIL